MVISRSPDTRVAIVVVGQRETVPHLHAERGCASVEDHRTGVVVPIGDYGDAANMGRASGCDDALLGQMGPQCVDRLGAIRHHRRLLGLALHRHKPHGRARRCLCDRLRIGHVVFLAFQERLRVGRRDQPDLVTEIADCPAPVMGARARIHRIS